MGLAPLLILLLLLGACLPAPPEASDGSAAQPSSASSRAAKQRAAPTPIVRPLAAAPRVELVADGLQLPANLTFAPDGRLFFTEVSLGRVRVVDHGQLQPEPFIQVDPATRPENGLLGLALDPTFVSSRFIYLFYSQERAGKHLNNRVVRFTEVDGKGTDMRVLLDGLPNANQESRGSHNGGRLGFGPDGKLYVTVGDAGDMTTAQERDLLSGKLLRINPDGSIPADNPFRDSPVYALGLRNPWGLAFHPLTGVPYVTDNGQEGRDEVDRIEPRGNYGWPKVQGIVKAPRYVDPLWISGLERGGVTGITFYTGAVFPEYRNDLLFCILARSELVRLRLAGPAYDRMEQEEVLFNSCHLDVTTGPEGAIYVSTVSSILRLLPAQ